jgi:hypothetical protein
MIVFRSISDPKVLTDKAMAASRKFEGQVLLGYEQGDSENLEHTYTYNSERTEARCDGEECGRRLKCFSDGKPQFPRHWSMRQAMMHMEEIHDMYTKMKKTELMGDLLALKITGKRMPSE